MKHWENFLDFEARNELFTIEENGLRIWDTLRYLVYLDYMWENFQEQRHKPKKWALVVSQLRRIRTLFVFLFRKSRPNLFFLNSRDRLPDGRYYDRNANDFLERMLPESHILENFEDLHCKYLYPVSLFNFAYIFKRIYYRFYRRRDYSGLAEKINSQLGLEWDSPKINKVVGYFRGERMFYKWLFRLKKTKRVFVTFAVPKALYCAARESGVETIEFQHGIIDRGHIAYNYPAGISGKQVYCPDILLTFSPFWCQDAYYPVGRIIPIGNTILADIEMGRKSFDPQKGVVGFISADVFGQSLAELAIEYTRLHPENAIFFKLHPNQFNRRKEYYKLFQDYPAITVVTNEQPTERMVAACDAIVLIQSTIAYEALQAGVPVFIYKRMTYYRHDHIFDSPNVRLIDGAEQIELSGKPLQPGPRDIFFNEFDESVYRWVSRTEYQPESSANAEQATAH